MPPESKTVVYQFEGGTARRAVRTPQRGVRTIENDKLPAKPFLILWIDFA
jgi:hypothetical protein